MYWKMLIGSLDISLTWFCMSEVKVISRPNCKGSTFYREVEGRPPTERHSSKAFKPGFMVVIHCVLMEVSCAQRSGQIKPLLTFGLSLAIIASNCKRPFLSAGSQFGNNRTRSETRLWTGSLFSE